MSDVRKYLMTEHVNIENWDKAMASPRLKYRRYWMRNTTTPPPPMPPMVASIIITIRIKVPMTSIGFKGNMVLCSQTPSKRSSLLATGS